MMKKISVIIPIYQGKQYIPNLLQMLDINAANLKGKYNLEVIIVNDSPEEGEIVDEAKSDKCAIRIINHKKNCGIHQSRIDGLLASDADYVCFLDQDDLISPVFFRLQMEALSNEDAIICNGKIRSEEIFQSQDEFDLHVSKETMLKGYNYIVSPGQVVIKRDKIPKIWINNVLHNNGADDFFLWMSMMLGDCSFAFNDKVIYAHLYTEVNTSGESDVMNRSVIEFTNILYDNGLISEGEKNTIVQSREERPINSMVDYYKKREKESRLMYLWKKNDLKGLRIEDYLRNKGVSSVSIYGMGSLGQLLVEEILHTDITLNAIIDRRKLGLFKKVPVVGTENSSEIVKKSELIIVTVLFGFIEIKEQLQHKYDLEIVSLESILNNMDIVLEDC